MEHLEPSDSSVSSSVKSSISFGISRSSASSASRILQSSALSSSKKEAVVSFSDKNAVGKVEKKEAQPLVIPALPNTFGLLRQFPTSSDVSPSSPISEAAVSPPAPQSDDVQSHVMASIQADAMDFAERGVSSRIHQYGNNNSSSFSSSSSVPLDEETKKFRSEIETLPDFNPETLIKRAKPKKQHEDSSDDSEPEPEAESGDQPPQIEGFGAALLRGLGWTPGSAFGRADKPVEPVTYLRRPDRLGLGARPRTPSPDKRKYIKPGDSREKKDLVAVDSKGNITYNVKKGDERAADSQVVDRKALKIGHFSSVTFIRGPHKGMDGVVISKDLDPIDGSCVVRLHPSEEAVRAAKGDIELSVLVKARQREEKQMEAIRKESEDNSSSSSSRKRGREGASSHREDRDDRDSKKSTSSSSSSSSSASKDRFKWVLPGLRVKIVDKKAHNGTLYLKKGVIVDFSSPFECTVLLDNSKGKQVEGIRESMLETCVPKSEGSSVRILVGSHKGEEATIVQRDSSRSKAAVLLQSDGATILNLSFDDICEFEP